jgi:hypothetical protein
MSCVSGQLDSNWCVGAVFEKKLLPFPFTLALSGYANHPKAQYRFGVGLIVGWPVSPNCTNTDIVCEGKQTVYVGDMNYKNKSCWTGCSQLCRKWNFSAKKCLFGLCACNRLADSHSIHKPYFFATHTRFVVDVGSRAQHVSWKKMFQCCANCSNVYSTCTASEPFLTNCSFCLVLYHNH